MLKDLNDLAGWIPQWRRFLKLPGQVEALEAKVAELESRLAVAPGEACSQCGAPAMRLWHAGEMQDKGPNAWREELWMCDACRGGDHRIKRL